MKKGSDRKILVILFTGVLMGALDIAIVGPAIPSIETALNVDPRVLGLIGAVFGLAFLVGPIIAGAGFFLLHRHPICPDTDTFSFTRICYSYRF